MKSFKRHIFEENTPPNPTPILPAEDLEDLYLPAPPNGIGWDQWVNPEIYPWMPPGVQIPYRYMPLFRDFIRKHYGPPNPTIYNPMYGSPLNQRYIEYLWQQFLQWLRTPSQPTPPPPPPTVDPPTTRPPRDPDEPRPGGWRLRQNWDY